MDLQSFDLNLLLGFDAIYRHQNLSAAGHELGMTQPAMSAALRRMRDQFGDQLFVRTPHGMRPTPLADEVAKRVTQVLTLVREIDHWSAFEPSTTTVQYRIYLNDVGLIVLGPLLVKHLRDLAPHAQLLVVDLRPDEVVEALEKGEIDLAIGYFLSMPKWARVQTVRRLGYTCLVRRDHPTIGDKMTLEQFLACKHAMYASSGSLYQAVEQTLARMKLTREVALTVPRLGLLPFLVAESDMIATVPDDLGVVFENLINVRRVRPPMKLDDYEIRQYWHQRLHTEPAYIWLRESVARILKQLAKERLPGDP
jgi:DNA-binding transcriptional LysR family regulator